MYVNTIISVVELRLKCVNLNRIDLIFPGDTRPLNLLRLKKNIFHKRHNLNIFFLNFDSILLLFSYLSHLLIKSLAVSKQFLKMN